MKFNKYIDLIETHLYTEDELSSLDIKSIKPNKKCITTYNDTVIEILNSDGYVAHLVLQMDIHLENLCYMGTKHKNNHCVGVVTYINH